MTHGVRVPTDLESQGRSGNLFGRSKVAGGRRKFYISSMLFSSCIMIVTVFNQNCSVVTCFGKSTLLYRVTTQNWHNFCTS